MKTCPMCHIEKEISEFGFQGAYVKGYCRSCRTAYKKLPHQIEKTRANTKRKDVKRAYGISLEEYNETLKQCEICGATDDLCLDHCHDTEEIRGALCHTCNIGLGMFKNNPLLLTLAVKYLLMKGGCRQ